MSTMGIVVDPDWWKTMFDEVYLLTDARSVCNEDITRREVNIFCELMPLKPDERILDLCGGHGRHSLELCRRGFSRCTVLDYSKALLQVGSRSAARANHTIRFIQGDARQIDFPAEAFDHVLILGNSLGYIADGPADRQILEECFRVLCPGGWLLVDVTNGASVRSRFTPNAWHEIGADTVVCRQRQLTGASVEAREMVLNKGTGLVRDRCYSIRLYTPAELADLLAAAGFTGARIHEDFSPYGDHQGDYGFMNYRMIATAQRPKVPIPWQE